MEISVDIDISELTDEVRSELDLDSLITDAVSDALYDAFRGSEFIDAVSEVIRDVAVSTDVEDRLDRIEQALAALGDAVGGF